jgi:hypothetical protein
MKSEEEDIAKFESKGRDYEEGKWQEEFSRIRNRPRDLFFETQRH